MNDRRIDQIAGYAPKKFSIDADEVQLIIKRLRSTEAKLEKAKVALENCAKPGTYHMTGLCQPCQTKVQDWGNYVARECLKELND